MHKARGVPPKASGVNCVCLMTCAASVHRQCVRHLPVWQVWIGKRTKMSPLEESLPLPNGVSVFGVEQRQSRQFRRVVFRISQAALDLLDKLALDGQVFLCDPSCLFDAG